MTEETDTVSYKIVIAALTSTALISLAPNLILFLFPNYGKNGNKSSFVLSLGQALAAGGLLGDVFLHTLSHSHSHDHGHSHSQHSHSHHSHGANENNEETNQGLCILFGFTIFLIVDMIIRSLGGGGSCSHGGHSHSQNDESHSHNTHSHRPLENGDEHKKNIKPTENGDTHINSKDATTTTKRWLTSTVLLNLVADSLHNFTDGIAIGASYGATSHHANNESFTSLLYSSSRGSLATLSILFHEIPHELGDFCILVQNGFTRNQAIMLQFTTAIAAMIGTVVGLLATTTASFMNGDVMIYATSGGFIYLATVTILPEMLNDNKTNTIKQRIFQLVAFLIGIAFLYAVSLMEEHDHTHTHSHDHGHHHSHSHDHHDHEHSHSHEHSHHHQHEEL